MNDCVRSAPDLKESRDGVLVFAAGMIDRELPRSGIR